ncbi:HAD family hydrolase (plasmid) [Sinorhizobium meliloti]|nr:HAD family hydrolase [Sinorhizobium meliloti]WQP29238.1 HAD family hydrolase [Sinorhizobium meliloti]
MVAGTLGVRGFSFVYVIFDDGADPYWARSRVLGISECRTESPSVGRLGPLASTKTFAMAAAALLSVTLVPVADTLKPEAKEAIAALRSEGIEVILLTGDNERTATAVARPERGAFLIGIKVACQNSGSLWRR